MVAENQKNGIMSAQNFPLALLVLIVILFAELSSRRISKPGMLLLAIPAVLFLVSSFYLLPTGRSSDEASVLAYVALMLQLSTVVVIFSRKGVHLGRIIATFLLISAAFTLAGFIYTFSDGQASHFDSRQDAVVVLGASVWGKHRPSPLLCGRLDEAIKIFKSGLARKIIATGGTIRFGTVESEVQAWYLRENGVPDSSMITEHNTLCTSEQAAFVKSVLIDSLRMKRIVIVSDKWHLPRALLMCRWEDANVQGAASDYRLPILNELYFRMRESAALQAYFLFGA